MWRQISTKRHDEVTRPRRAAVRLASALLTLAVVCVGSLAAATASASAASGTTPLLGNTSVPRIPRAGISEGSLCPSGAFVVGARVWLDTFPRVTGVAALCTSSASSAPAQGALVGDTSDAVSFGDSLCNGTDLAIGLKAANGEVVNAFGVRCQGLGGTYDAAVVGNQATIRSDADCDSPGSALTGILGWSNIYGGPHINLYGAQGVCAPTDTTAPTATVAADRAPDQNGWYNHPFTATWSTSEPHATCTSTTYAGPATAAGSLSGYCTDAARNVGSPVPFTFKYDATAPTVTSKPATVGAPSAQKGFRVTVHDNLSGAASVQATLRPFFGTPRVVNATCVAGCGTTDSQWFVSTAGAFGIYKVTVRATDVAGNTSVAQ